MRTAHRIATVTAAALLGLAVAATPAFATTGFDVSKLTVDQDDFRYLTATGTASCDGDGSTEATVEIEVTQGPAFSTGFGYGIICDGTSQPWKANVEADDGTGWLVDADATVKLSFTPFGTKHPSPVTDRTDSLTLDVTLVD